MNSLSVTGTGAVGSVTLDILGAVSLTVGIELSLEGFETVVLSNSGLSLLATILNGLQGQIKMFVFQDINTTFQDSTTQLNGSLDLNTAPANGIYSPAVDEVIILVNIGGDGGLTTHGYWREVSRQASS